MLAANQDTFGGVFKVRINNEEKTGEVRDRGMGISVDLGKVALKPGPVEIEVSAVSITGKELMRLKGVTLVPEVNTPAH